MVLNFRPAASRSLEGGFREQQKRPDTGRQAQEQRRHWPAAEFSLPPSTAASVSIGSPFQAVAERGRARMSICLPIGLIGEAR